MKQVLILAVLLGCAWGQCPAPYTNARCDLTVTPVPSVPPQVGPNTCSAGNLTACGNLTGAGTTITDPDFGAKITRLTDANTSPVLAHSTMNASGGGSGDQMQVNCLNNRLTISDTGGRDYEMSWAGYGQPALPMYTGSLTGGFYTESSAPSWGHNCPTDQYLLYTVSNGVEGASSGFGPILGSWDFTSNSVAPTFTSIFDFTSSTHCLGAGFTVTWDANGEHDQSDNDFAMGFSNSGGQGGAGAVYIAVYRKGSGCRVLNLTTLTVDGDWGPTGAIVGSGCAGQKIHNVKIDKAGGSSGALILEYQIGCGAPSNSNYVWQYTGLNFGPQATVNVGGHWTEGVSTFANNAGNNAPNYWVTRPVGTASPSTGIVPTNPSGLAHTDWHVGWNSLDDTKPFGGTAYTTQGQAIIAPWQNEVILLEPFLNNPIRIAHTFGTGINQAFSTAIEVSSICQDNTCMMFSSDWENTLGNTSGGAPCVPNGPDWAATTAYNSGLITIINPNLNNAANDSFSATTPGTSGSSEPNWGTSCGTTCTDGTVTWTNLGGPPSCRGDVFMVQLIPSQSAPQLRMLLF